MASSRKKNNVISMNDGRKAVNIGYLIFAGLLFYICSCIWQYAHTKHIVGYEVVEGSISTNNIYTAIALRQEMTVPNAVAGPVYYFATEDRKVAAKDLVYVVDESDTLSQSKDVGSADNSMSLSESDYSAIQNNIEGFCETFSASKFSQVYDFKNSIQGSVSKLVNSLYLKNIDDLKASSQAFSYQYSPASGVVVYSVDGYEGLTLKDMKSDYFDQEKYNKTVFGSNEIIAANDPAYKLVTSEDWSVVINTDEETAKKLVDEKFVQVRFLKNQVKAWGEVSSFTNKDGETFVALTFTNSMITFASDRFLSIEIISNQEKGLKIPNSAIVKKEFYLIPKDYVVSSDNEQYVYRKAFSDDGTESQEKVSAQICGLSKNEKEYYIDKTSLRTGDILLNPSNDQTFTVSKVDSLYGVYNINKGYADFKEIVRDKRYSNDEYSIVKSNTKYGLSVYDYIVLDASAVVDDELIK
ncbi:HlyD family efflux transporter periplasmic adaptor subunit [Butyrivibrio sp. NC3005]|uniref:HlyD family efflux transporter periplasmic adaptor subunit n=1 Tax=Butyrivibrio sp. NC3005 TaxID=1280685 RepID=UPI001FA81067|nr:HlyD family efflux transporter periplasmic adaptor subunit [Butyrivibrio sp. NC3005]